MTGVHAFAALVTTGALAAGVLAQEPPAFRATVDAVSVGVSVRRGGRPVGGLKAGEFHLTDNGVPQVITSLLDERLPVDVTVLLDVSGSITDATMAMLRRSVGDLRQDLRPADRLRVLSFNLQVRRVLDLDAPGQALDAAFAGIRPGGSSAVYDALVVALASPAAPDRRQFIALFSDGLDNGSISREQDLLDVARRTTPTVSVLLATPVRRPPPSVYSDLATATGGTVVSVMPSDRLGDGFRRVLEEFRSGYVLTFTPTGVPRGGSHRLEVAVDRTGVDVRARRGYALP